MRPLVGCGITTANEKAPPKAASFDSPHGRPPQIYLFFERNENEKPAFPLRNQKNKIA
jgi:hypothetical protein